MGRLLGYVAAALLAGSALSLSGQTLKGTLLGTITDSSHAVVPGVQVVVTETNTNFRRAELTNDSGFFVFANLDPGTYRVEVEHPGFRRVIRAGMDLAPNSTARVDLELSPGAVSEVVEVTAEATLLQTDRADTGGKIESKQLDTMPLPFNRNYQGLLSLIPGVGRAFRPHSEFYNSQDHLSARVNGQGRQANNYQLEGIDNNLETSLTAMILPAEAIATVDVSTSDYDPEFGRAGGAVTNVTMRSGANAFHGSLFEFHRDSYLRARNVFATNKAPTTYNQFGGTFGGRIIRDKTFFFGDYQASRDHLGQTNLATIPTLPFRAGDLSASPTTIYDAATGAADGTGRQPFANNRIPASRISPIAQRILGFIPGPTAPGLGTNFQNNTLRVKNLDQFDIKVDEVFGPRDRLSVRYSYQKAVVTDEGMYGIYGGPHNGGFSGSGPARSQSPGINYSHIFSPTLITEVRFGMVRNRNDAINTDTGLTTSRDIGIPGVNVDAWSSGLTQIDIDGYTGPVVGFSASLPWARATTNFGVVNNWTKTLRNHVLKFGYDIRRERVDLQQTQTFNPRGRFSFRPGPAALNGDRNTSFGNSFASFLLDLPNQLGRDLTVVFPARRNTVYNLYFQDKWQVSPKLTLDLGLRWEYWPSSTPHHPAGFSNYNPANNTLELAGIGSIPMNLGIVSQKKSFAPRFGTAYRLNSKTVLRGGYGISYLWRNTAEYNFPVKQANSFDAVNSFSAAGSMATGFPPPTVIQIPNDGIIRDAPAQSYDIIPKDFFQAYVQSWNLALQRALPANFSLDLAYVGNHGINIPTTRETNFGRIPGAGAAGQPLNQLFGRRASTTTFIGTHTYYDSLQVRFDRRFFNGFLLTTSYAFSKAIDFCTDSCSLFDSFNVSRTRGRSDFDRTHVFVQSFIYELPFGPKHRWAHSGPARWLLGDWQMNGILTSQTGDPLSITFSNATLNAPLSNNRPNLNGQSAIFGAVGPGSLWFDTSKFTAPAPNTFGNSGRNILSGPGLVNLDFSLFRAVPVTERIKLEVRLESFNLSNTPHFDKPNTALGNANFGQVTTAGGSYTTGQGDQRQFQVALRLFF
ncbi:MAG: TonB-dependent receptor [Acidobacteria bacterium]|nr:TonB-dependent receptor [Acidobacteriota bacterium]